MFDRLDQNFFKTDFELLFPAIHLGY